MPQPSAKTGVVLSVSVVLLGFAVFSVPVFAEDAKEAEPVTVRKTKEQLNFQVPLGSALAEEPVELIFQGESLVFYIPVDPTPPPE